MKCELLGLTVTATWRSPMWLLRLLRRPHAWTLHDLQICIDELDYFGVRIDRLRCNHATRRHLLRLMEAENRARQRLHDTIPIEAERDLEDDILIARQAGGAREFYLYPQNARVANSAGKSA